jgi:hypothetical protein
MGGFNFMTVAVPLFILIVIAAIIYGYYAGLQRKQALASWAARNALSFNAENIRRMEEAYPAFQCLHEGNDRFACNLMEGKWSGRAFRAFDYQWSTGSGKDTETHNFSAIILESPVPLKPLLIRTENVFDHVAEFFGAEGIKFESAEFSRAFHVKSPDRKWAYDVLHPRAMEFLLSMPRFEIQFDDTAVMAHRASTFSVQDFESAAKVAQGLLDGLPEYVKAQQQDSGA